MTQKNKAAAAVILAGILWGIISLFIRRLSSAGMEALQISLVRLFVAAIVFTLFLLITDKKKLKIRPRDIWMFIGTGVISVTLFNSFYFYTMINSQASIAVVLLYTSPVWVMLFSAVLFRERITLRKVIVIVMTFAGCVGVTGLLDGQVQLTVTVLITGLLSGLFYALYTIFGKYALKAYDSMTVTAYTFIFGFFSSLPFGKPVQIIRLCGEQPSLILWGIGIGIFCTVMPYFLYTWGLKYLESGKAAILVAVEPLVGAVLGMTLYKENHSPAKLAGIVLILAAIVLLNMKRDKKQADN